MTRLALADIVSEDFPAKVSDYEIINGYKPTYFLLCDLSKEYPECEFYFAVGSDLIRSIQYWDEGDKLLSEFKFIVIARPNYSYEDLDAIFKSYFIVNVTFGGSSTEIRKKLKEITGKQDVCTKKKYLFSIMGLTSKSVIEYILKNNLYDVISCNE